MLNVKGIVQEKHEVFPTLLWIKWNNNKGKVWFQRNIDFSCCRPDVLRITNTKQEHNQNNQLYSEDNLIAKAQWWLKSFSEEKQTEKNKPKQKPKPIPKQQQQNTQTKTHTQTLT